MTDPGVPGLRRALHVGLGDAGRRIDGGELTRIVVRLGALGDRTLSRCPELLQLGVELLDPGADLLCRAGGLATCDEIASGTERLAAIEAQLVEEAVQPLAK